MAEEIDYKKLAEAQAIANAKYLKQGGGGGGGSKGTGMGAIDVGVETFKKAIDPFGSALGVAGKGVSALSDALNEGKDAWRDLSKSGAGFNNDIVGMTVAAAGTRLPLREFAGVIKDNTDILGQLGGSVTRGAESFARMSKGFFESGATDSLKQLGYTNKDLNEVLALQAITLRGSFKDEQERNAVAIENATKLATEMDLMAKLTGKSREAQMEQMKKNQMDMQFEAAIRLKTAGMSAEEAAKFEANARSQLKDAQLRGAGDMFKEVFATGQIQSKEAATQAAVNQEQAAATMRQAQASAIGDQRAADAANREAQRAAVADANNTTKLGMVALGAAGGQAGKALTDSMGAQITYTKSLEATAAANGYDLKTKEGLIQAQQKMEEEAKKAQSGKNEKGEQVDGVTKAAVTLENTVDKVRAGLTAGLLEPLNKEVGPKLGEFAKNVDAMNKNFGGSGKDTSRAIEDSTKKGFAQGVSDKTTNRYEREPGAGGPLGIAESVGGLAGGGTKLLTGGIDKVNQYMEPKKRQGGSLDMTGGMFENWGKGEMVELHGMEGVMRPQDIEKIVETSLGGAKKSLSSASAGDISKSISNMPMPKFEMPKMPNMEMPKFEMPKMPKMEGPKMEMPNLTAGGGIGGGMGGLDLSSITKNLNTSFSSLTSGIKLPDVKELSMPFSSAFKDFNLSFSSITKDGAEKIAKTPIPKEPFDEFGSNFDEVVAKMAADVSNAMPLDAMDQNAAALEYASKRRAELEQLMSDGQARTSKEWDEIFDEAIQLDGQIDKLVTKQIEAMTNYSDGWDESGNMMDKINSDIVEAVGGSKSKIAQDKIDVAIEEKKKANETIAFMLNNIADEDWDDEAQAAWDEAIDRRDAAKEKLDKVIEESIGDLADGFDDFGDGWNDSVDKITADIADSLPVDTEFGDLDGAMAKQASMQDNEFGDLDGAMAKNQADDETRSELARESKRGAMKDVVAGSSPTATQSRGITMDSFTLGPNGMPIAKPKSTAAATPDKPAEKQASPGKKINPETGEEYTPVGDAKPGDKSGDKKGAASGGEKAATLDDVVKSINALNTKMGQLIAVNEDGHKASAKAAKSGSNNLYAR